MKTLVCYFSATGNTKKVAEMIKDAFDGDIFEIEPQIKYSKDDLDWNNKFSRSTIEMEDKTSRPAVVKKVDNISDYDTVIIGFPVWWYTAPTIVNTFIDENDLSGKKIYVFVTSGGSSHVGSIKDLRANYPNLNFVDGKRLYNDSTKDDVSDWMDKDDLWEN